MGGQLSSSVRSWVFGSYSDNAEPNRPVPTPSPFVLHRRGAHSVHSSSHHRVPSTFLELVSFAYLPRARYLIVNEASMFDSMYFDDDGDLAHEFYEEGIEFINGTRRATLKRIQFNLIPQGVVQLEHPRLHVDLPVVLYETCDLN